MAATMTLANERVPSTAAEVLTSIGTCGVGCGGAHGFPAPSYALLASSRRGDPRWSKGILMRLSGMFTSTRFLVVAAALVAALVAAVLVVPGGPAAAAVSSGAQFVSTAGRILDTRDGTGGYTTAMPANAWRTVQVTGKFGIPSSSSVTAVALNVIEVSPSGLGQVTARPNASTAATLVGTFDGGGLGSTSNEADVAVNSDGTVQVRADASTQLVIDVEGYYSTDPSATGGYVAIAGKRYVGEQPVAASGNFTVQVTGVNGIPSNATAVVADFVVKNQGTTHGYISPGPAGSSPPATSLHFPGATDVATAISAHVPLSSDGKLEVWNRAGSAIKVNLDIEGYFVPGSSTAGSFTAGAARAFDSRVKPHVSIAAGKTVTVPLGGTHGVPSTADGLSSVVADLTAIHASNDTAGFARAWADGTAEPNISDVEYAPNSIRSNTNTVPVGLDGAIEIHNLSSATVDYVVDIEGWYAGGASTMCANDTDSILGQAADASSATVGASEGDPVLSAVLTNSLADPINGQIYVLDSSGKAVDGSPTATETVDNGAAMTFHLPPAYATPGATFTWWVHAYQDDACAAQATSARHSFVVGSPTTAAASKTQRLTISGDGISTTSAPEGQGDCSGSPCPLNSGEIALGMDAENADHATALHADLSTIPAGATIASASLNITPSGCYGTACSSGTLSIAQATENTSSAETGAALAAIEVDTPLTFPEAPSTTAYDITSLVNDWYDSDGVGNFGAVLSETNTVTGATGEIYYGPTSAVSPASITINYIPADAPGPIRALKATGGDGGLIAAWASPIRTGWYDTTGATDGITSYTVSVSDAAGSTVATKTVGEPRAVFTGLTNGAAYTVSVAANNTAGSGTTSISSSTTPAAVINNPSLYVNALQNLVDAESKLASGSEASTSDAIGATSTATIVTPALGLLGTSYLDEFATESENDQSDAHDITTLTDTLAVPTAAGVTLFATATRTFTTVDTSGGPAVDVDGESDDAGAYLFTVHGTKASLGGYADQDALLQPTTTSSTDTAEDAAGWAASAEPDPTSASTVMYRGPTGGNINAKIATTHTFARTEMGVTGPKVNLSGVANWALRYSTEPHSSNWFSPDCTNFVSRALHWGGLANMVGNEITTHISHDANRWFLDRAFGKNIFYSMSWGHQPENYNFQMSHGGVSVGRSNVKLGYLAYAAFNGGGKSSIDHAAVVTKVTGSNIYVSQHSHNTRNEAIFGSGHTWSHLEPQMSPPFYVNPYGI
ncbi:amidase domain-containing protein [Curtobacterium flaccumfaciens]|uniref:amidase domain-containing protein n=1 Tax=Curtobacterium flaccumfaciens TaxID=2035 RepID=UPI001ADD28D6|nr:amidase domain-containing protein [Curtobacterium flaccumfaciens]MBO9042629.1 amidase domain-containing protein [Curtobacterium flaccumfaciens pv. flaccumfaciens]